MSVNKWTGAFGIALIAFEQIVYALNSWAPSFRSTVSESIRCTGLSLIFGFSIVISHWMPSVHQVSSERYSINEVDTWEPVLPYTTIRHVWQFRISAFSKRCWQEAVPGLVYLDCRAFQGNMKAFRSMRYNANNLGCYFESLSYFHLSLLRLSITVVSPWIRATAESDFKTDGWAQIEFFTTVTAKLYTDCIFHSSVTTRSSSQKAPNTAHCNSTELSYAKVCSSL